MIVSKLWARLGNQCFMCVAAISHARRMGTTYAFPKHTLDPRIWPTYFKLPIAKYATRDYYKEPRHGYDELPASRDLTIEGYFQSWKYFQYNEVEVAEVLGFKLNPVPSIAIHVRRGDYLQYPDQFPVLPEAYYEQALKEGELKGYKNYKVYSDDIPWCMSFFRKFNNLRWNFTYSQICDPLQDMRNMYNHAGFIISNSSYSLFPASLRSDEPLVIAPNDDRWYGEKNKSLETADMYKPNWIKI